MESLPNELLLRICQHLSARDCCRLASTCSRLHDIQPGLLARFNVTELVIRTEEDCLPIDFVRRNLSANITHIRVNVEEFGVSFAEKLKGIAQACPKLKVLKFDAPYASKDKNRRKTADLLNEFVPSLSVKELHAGCFDGHLILPPTVEKCTLSANYFDDSRAVDEHARAMRSRIQVSSRFLG